MKATQQIPVNRILLDHLLVPERIFPDARVIFNVDLKRRGDKFPVAVKCPFRNLLAIVIQRIPFEACIQFFQREIPILVELIHNPKTTFPLLHILRFLFFLQRYTLRSDTFWQRQEIILQCWKKTRTKAAFYIAFHYLCTNSGRKSRVASMEGHTEKRKSVYDIIPNSENRQFSIYRGIMTQMLALYCITP